MTNEILVRRTVAIPGTRGPAGTIASASTVTLPPESDATVIMSGDEEAKHVEFGIPQGKKGDKGDPGNGNVDSVNGQIGPNVVLSPKDVLSRGVADMVDALQFPLYIAHRGSSNVYPEHSIEAYRNSFEGGFTPEADVRALADGRLVCIHDATTTRTMNISKSVSAVTSEEWRSALVKPPKNGDRITGTGYGTPVFFEDYLDEFGGRVVLWPEIKVTGAPAVAMIKAVTDRGLQRATVIQSGDLATCKEIVAAGCHALILTNTVPAADIAAAGIEFVGVSMSATNAYVSALIDAGMKVIAYTTNTKADADAQFARGCVGVFSDDPWEVSRLVTNATELPQVLRGWLPRATSHSVEHSGASDPGGHNQAVSVSDGALVFTGGRATNPVSYPNSIRIGEFGVGITSATVRFWAQADGPWAVTSPEISWLAGVYLGKQDGDAAVNEEPGSAVFTLAMIRRNGEKNIYEKRTAAGATTKIGTAAAPSTPYAKPGGRSVPMLFEVVFTPTSVSIKNLTLNDTDATATRTALNIAGAYLSFCVTGANSRIWGITVSKN